MRVEDEDLVVELELVELPAELPFNQSGVQNNLLEYEWSVSIDTTGDGFDDVEVALRYFKYDTPAEDLMGDPLEFAQRDVTVFEGNVVEGGDVEPEVERTDGGIRFELPLDAYPVLEDVGEDTIVFFRTLRYAPGWSCEDSL